jgi:VIT1/CCC1 family predicted Fe2+/Mn2+ transporter
MFCVKCGAELPDDSKFCSKCGVSTVNNSAKTSVPPKVEQKYKKEYIGNFEKNSERTDYDPTYGCGYESSTEFSSKKSWKTPKAKREFSWQVIREIIFTFVIPFIGSFILVKLISIFGQNASIPAAIGVILLFIIAWILWAIGKYIGKRLSNETGLVLGIILILIGITLYIGIPIIIYSSGAKQIEIV